MIRALIPGRTARMIDATHPYRSCRYEHELEDWRWRGLVFGLAPALPSTVPDTPRPALVRRPAADAPMSSMPAITRPRRSGRFSSRPASQSALAVAPFAVLSVMLANCHRYSNSA